MPDAHLHDADLDITILKDRFFNTLSKNYDYQIYHGFRNTLSYRVKIKFNNLIFHT